jgi:hypothetical protein
VLYDLKDKLTEDELKMCKNAIKEQTKKVLVILDVYNITKDVNDTVHSLKQWVKLSKK